MRHRQAGKPNKLTLYKVEEVCRGAPPSMTPGGVVIHDDRGFRPMWV